MKKGFYNPRWDQKLLIQRRTFFERRNRLLFRRWFVHPIACTDNNTCVIPPLSVSKWLSMYHMCIVMVERWGLLQCTKEAYCIVRLKLLALGRTAEQPPACNPNSIIHLKPKRLSGKRESGKHSAQHYQCLSSKEKVWGKINTRGREPGLTSTCNEKFTLPLLHCLYTGYPASEIVLQ